MIAGLDFEISEAAKISAEHEKAVETSFYMCLQYGFCPKCSSELKHDNPNKLGVISCTDEECGFKFDFTKRQVL